MKLAKIPFGIAVGLSLLMTSATPPSRELDRLRLGEVFPEMNIEVDVQHKLTPKTETGKYTLFHFWGTYDAASRAKNVQWCNYFASLEQNSRINYRPICIDPDEDVYLQTLNLDGVNPEQQLFAGGTARNQLLKIYKIEEELTSFLVDDQGIIRAINPTSVELEQLYLH